MWSVNYNIENDRAAPKDAVLTFERSGKANTNGTARGAMANARIVLKLSSALMSHEYTPRD